MEDRPIDCPHCGRSVPDAPYCISCGEPLAVRPPPVGGRRWHAFAAAPGESVRRIAPFSTLLPHLPEADLDAFRIAFAGGLLVLLVLLAIGAYPVALVVAAVLVPTVILIYIYSVDVYEDTPLVAIALTMAWGTAWGIAFGVATRAVSHAASRFGGNQLGDIVLFGVAVPLAGEVAMVVGPLVLLRIRSFNDVLDGATFGVTSAVTFVGAQVIAGSLDLFSGGPTPIGEPLAWVARIVSIAVALPIVAAGSIGSVVGAFWLRYRSPVRDRDELGVAGRPVAAVVMAGVLLVAAALATYLPGPIVDLAVQLGLAALALLWLRRTLHLGLLEEAREIEIGDEIICANCGLPTRRHTFCGNCGISLQALPKARRRPPR